MKFGEILNEEEDWKFRWTKSFFDLSKTGNLDDLERYIKHSKTLLVHALLFEIKHEELPEYLKEIKKLFIQLLITHDKL